VQLYRPLGFHATLSFLEELAGPFERDEDALLRALDRLAASRAEWQAEVRRYAAVRSAAKRLGHRTTRAADPNPSRGPAFWYGDQRRAALHALRYWHRSRLPRLLAWDDPGASDIDAAVTACLAAGGPLSTGQRELLRAAVQRQRERLYQDDQVAYFRARDLITVAELVASAADAAPTPA
jgi:hypothetical protein